MINFRYHVVSMIAVFLALGIGIIMGTAVIDRAVVDRLERQQSGLQNDVDEVQAENNRLRNELRDEREAARQLAEEGSLRLLDGELTDVPVLVVGQEDAEAAGHDALVSLLGQADASYGGTLWFTDRFRLEDDGEQRDLAAVLSFDSDASAGSLRSAALTRLARRLRPAVLTSVATTTPEDTGEPDDIDDSDDSDVLTALVDAGFLRFDAAEGGDETLPVVHGNTRIVMVSGPDETGTDRRLLLPLLRALVAPLAEVRPVTVLATTGTAATGDDDDTFLGPIRGDDVLSNQVSTVDGIDDFAGRVAAVLAIADLGTGRVGHYGRGPGSERLLPAPAE